MLRRCALLAIIFAALFMATDAMAGSFSSQCTTVGDFHCVWTAADGGQIILSLNLDTTSAAGRYVWTYTIKNPGYGEYSNLTPYNPAGGNGLSGFYIVFPDVIPDLSSSMNEGSVQWESDCCTPPGSGDEWDMPAAPGPYDVWGPGIMPGESLWFSFQTDHRIPMLKTANPAGSHMHSWDTQPTQIAFFVGDIFVPGQLGDYVPPATPEPASLLLLLTGTAPVLWRRRRR
jgi:hypothetical protein